MDEEEEGTNFSTEEEEEEGDEDEGDDLPVPEPSEALTIVPACDPEFDLDCDFGEGEDDDGQDGLQVADVDFDTNELAKGLESLLDDLKLDSKITERYKYKLMNKYNLLLNALVCTHEREFEVVQHLDTKRQILVNLKGYLKNEVSSTSDKSDPSPPVRSYEEEEDSIEDVRSSITQMTQRQDEVSVSSRSVGLPIEEMNVKTIRQNLLLQKNRLDVLEAMKLVHVLKLKQKEYEKTLLTLQYSKLPKPSDVNKEMKEGRKEVSELQSEIASMQQEIGQIETEVRIQEKAVGDEDKILEKLELEAMNKQAEVAVLQSKPMLIQKEADRDAGRLEQLQDSYDTLCQKQVDTMEVYRIHQDRINKLRVEINVLSRDEQKLNNNKKNALREIERLMSQMEALMTREQIMLDKAAIMTEKIQQANKQKKRNHDEQQRISADAHKAHRISQRLERSIRLASEAYFNAKLAHEKMRGAFDAARPSDEDSNWQKLSRMLQKEIHNLKAALEKKLEESGVKASMVDRLKHKLNDLYDEQVSTGKELQELIRTTVLKRREREEKSEQCVKLDSQIQRFDFDIKMRELIIEDCQRTCRYLAKQIESIQKKIGIVNLEKSAVMNDILIQKQTAEKARSALKSVQDDMDRITQRLHQLERDSKGRYYLILNARLERNSVRNETLRNRDKFRLHRNQKNELLLQNRTLRKELERQKDEIAEIKNQCETALNDSNSIAMSVKEKIEEICTFAVANHAYDKILLKGWNEITTKSVEKTKLVGLFNELKKHMHNVRKSQPIEPIYRKRIEELRNEFYEITETRRKLEKQFNDDDNPERVREIKFDLMKTKENIPALGKRLDTVEELLAYRDAVGLERELIEKHVTKITDDSLIRAMQLKETYQEEVKIKVELRKNLANLSRRIEGFTCENSIAATQAETAEVLFLRFKEEVEEAEANFAAGLPPSAEIEAEWNHLQWRNKMLRKAYQKKSGFLFPPKHKAGYQIQAEKLKAGLKRRTLENPEDSLLGWSFSAENSDVIRRSINRELRFHNSAVNPRLSAVSACQVNRRKSNTPATAPEQKRKSSPLLFRKL